MLLLSLFELINFICRKRLSVLCCFANDLWFLTIKCHHELRICHNYHILIFSIIQLFNVPRNPRCTYRFKCRVTKKNPSILECIDSPSSLRTFWSCSLVGVYLNITCATIKQSVYVTTSMAKFAPTILKIIANFLLIAKISFFKIWMICFITELQPLMVKVRNPDWRTTGS